VADRALHDDVDALHRDAAARGGIAVDHQQAAAPVAPADWLASPATCTKPDIMFSPTPTPALPWTRDRGLLVHAAAVVADDGR
jgi:hypothetical protein